MVDTLVEGCQAKNGTLAEIAIGYLGDLIKNLDLDYLLSGSDSSRALIYQLVIEIEGKRMKMKKSAEAVLKDVKAKVGLEQIERLLKEVICGDEINNKEKFEKIMKLFEQKSVKKVDKSHDFRSFLK